MSWPSLQDYNETVQSPKTAFGDPELRLGTAELNQLGLPRPRSGQFATVYTFNCGPKRYAVRCFAKEIPDIRERYTAIGERLKQVGLPQMVQFDYLAEGIRIGGRWYPIVKMEWIQGELLPVYIEKNLHNPTALLGLAREFVDLFRSLQSASIAHGDLQHGNIVVVSGKLRLIDYDGMFVPSLQGRQSNETGHRNYQHPRRTGFDFGPGMDAFSAWVIYVSLILLANNPALWTQFGGGDECLLFRREDFENPEKSALIATIESSADASVAALVSLFKSLFYLSPSQVPALDAKSISIPIGLPQTLTGQPPVPQGADAWWQDHTGSVAKTVASSASGAVTESPGMTLDSSWVLDFLQPATDEIEAYAWGETVSRERWALTATLWTIALVTLIGPSSLAFDSALGIVLAAIGVNVAYWRMRFEHLPAVSERKAVDESRRQVEGRQRAGVRVLKEAEQALASARAAYVAAEKRAKAERQTLNESERDRIERANKDWQTRIGGLRNQRAALAKQEADALQEVSNSLGGQRAALLKQVQLFDSAQQKDLSDRLAELQRDHIAADLSKVEIRYKTIPGLGPGLKAALAAHGINTAGDVSQNRVSRVPGFGVDRTRAMTTWRDQFEADSRRSMPLSLPSVEDNAIRAKYSVHRAALEADVARLSQQISNEETRIRTHYNGLSAPVDHGMKAAQAQLVQATEAIRHQSTFDRSTLEEAIQRALKQALDLIAGRALQVQDRRAKLLPLQWEGAKLQQKLRRYESVTFKKFALHIMMLGRSRR